MTKGPGCSDRLDRRDLRGQGVPAQGPGQVKSCDASSQADGLWNLRRACGSYARFCHAAHSGNSPFCVRPTISWCFRVTIYRESLSPARRVFRWYA